MKTINYKILEEKNIIDDHLLDIIGNEFKFNHEKGISEWLKNAVDAYIRTNVPDSKQCVILRFTDGKNKDAIFECIDFIGMTAEDINHAFKIWGDPEAAKRGSAKKVYGGHGNGGKFYMRQMFSESHFITYKNGFLNIFGFNKSRHYGFADKFKNKKIKYDDALQIAGLKEKDIPSEHYKKIKNNETGFTVVKGMSPTGMRNQIKVHKICAKLQRHPQAMRIIERINLQVVHNNQLVFDSLKPEKIKPLKGFEVPLNFKIPEQIIYKNDGEEEVVFLANKKYEPGELILKTSEIALTSNSKYSELNRIDIIGELGVIASYHLRELGLYYPQTDFIFGECFCPILEDPDDDCVTNDRSKLVENSKSKVLSQFIAEQVEELCKKISLKEKKENENINKKISSDYNNFLDQWKNRFMSKVLSEILVGQGAGTGGGFGEDGLFSGHGNGKNDSKKDSIKEGSNKGGNNISKKGNKYPRVLLSGHDEDPLNLNNKLFLRPGQGLVYQRPQDVNEGIYWINTSSPLAETIIRKYGADSSRWRDYLFQRYIDIFIKEALIKLERKEPDRFNAVTIDGDILGKLVSKIHEAASKDLNSFLFDDHYSIK